MTSKKRLLQLSLLSVVGFFLFLSTDFLSVDFVGRVGSSHPQVIRSQSEEDIALTVENFQTDSRYYTGTEVHVTSTIYETDILPDRIVGMCIPLLNTVLLNKSFWGSTSHLEQEELLYHELGHCELGRWFHEKEEYRKTDEGHICATSMMMPSMVGEKCYFERRDYYLRELFNVRPKDKGLEIR